MSYIIDGIEYVEVEAEPVINDYVVSSEQLGIPRIYKVYSVHGVVVLGEYSRGHTNLWYYKVLKKRNLIK